VLANNYRSSDGMNATNMDDRGIMGWIRDHWEAWAGASAVLLYYAAKTKKASDHLRSAWAWVGMFFGSIREFRDSLAVLKEQNIRIENELKPLKEIAIKANELHNLSRFAAARSRFSIASTSRAVYETTATGECTWASPGLCALFGLHSDQMTGSGWMQNIAEEDVERVRMTWHRAINEDLPYVCSYTVVRMEEGKRYKCHTTATAVRDSSGKAIGYIGTVDHQGEII